MRAPWNLASLHEMDVTERNFSKPYCKEIYPDSLPFDLTAEINQFQSIIKYPTSAR
jgi:hypothetical protein